MYICICTQLSMYYSTCQICLPLSFPFRYVEVVTVENLMSGQLFDFPIHR